MINAAHGETAAVAVAQRYFDAIRDHDVDGMVACWRPGGIDHMVGEKDLAVPEELRAHFDQLFAAFPDFDIEIAGIVSDESGCAVRWVAEATFDGASFQGITATNHRTRLAGCDVLRVDDGLIIENHAYYDTASLPRDIGLMPRRGSSAESVMLAIFNASTTLRRRFRTKR